jgi:hypothetical protein
VTPTRLTALCIAAALSSCVVVPQTRDVYDAECQITSKEIVLEVAVLGRFHGCSGQGCAAMMATLGIVTAASVVISSSVAVVGNVLYWAEKQGRCVKPQAATAAPLAVSAPK